MTSKEKLEHAAILLLNLVIIVCAETVGGGSYFFRTRLIEGIALLFTVLPLVRIFTDFRIYDPTITYVIQMSSVALLIFTESHATAYVGHYFLSLGENVLSAFVANFYVGALLVLIIGAELVLGRISRRNKVLLWLSTICFLGVTALTLGDALGVVQQSFEVASPWPLIYTFFIAGVTVLGFVSFDRLRSHLPLLKGFLGYFMVGSACVALSAFADFLTITLAEGFGWPTYQVVYAGAFFFYAAVSMMFLAFGKLRGFGGIYKDLQEEEESAKE